MRRGKQKVRISGVVTEIGRDKSPRKVNSKEDRKSSGRRKASSKIVEQDPLALPKPKKTKAKAKPVLTKAARKQPAEPEEYEVEKIVDHKQIGRKISYRIRWRGWAAKDDTWQLEDDLNCAAILKKYKAAMGPASPKKKTSAAAAAKASPKKRGRPSLNASKSGASPKKKTGVATGRVTKAKGRGRPPKSGAKASPRKKKSGGRPKKKDREWEVEEVVAVRMTEAGLEEFYIKWKNYSSEENTWEPAENVANCTSAIYRFRKSQGDGPLNGSAAPAEGDDNDDEAAAVDEADDAGDKSTAAEANQDEEEADKAAEKEVVDEDEDTNNGDSVQE